jgi:hypothetical protein
MGSEGGNYRGENTIMATTRILTDGLTNKQRILRMVERWDENISFEQALYHMDVMRAVMESIRDVEKGGRLVDHDEFFDELERLCDEEEKNARLVTKSQKKSKGPSSSHGESGNAKNGKVLRKQAKKVRQTTS